MRIKEFSIMRYGPLSKMERISLGNFNLLFGNNEEGKTLSIDALVKMLLGRSVREFAPGIHRVEENPEGYVIMEGEKNREIKLPEKGNIIEKLGLTPSDCRNIFIIRDSDLAITGESEFYTNVTDRLTGLRTKQILAIKKKLMELGILTAANSSASIANRKESGKIGSRLGKASKRIEEIDGLRDEIKREEFDALEEKSNIIGEKIGEVNQKLEMFEQARKREKYEKGERALKILRQSLEKTGAMVVYSQEDEQLWRDSQRDIKTNEEEKEKLEAKLRGREEALRTTSKELKGKEAEFRTFEERIRKVNDEVKPKVKDYQERKEKFKLREVRDRLFTYFLIASIILLGISLFGIAMRLSLLFYILASSFGGVSLILAVLKGMFTKDRGSLSELFEKIKFKTSRFGLEAGSIEGIISHIQKFDEEFTEKASELEEMRGDKKILEREIEELKEERIAGIEKNMTQAREVIEKVKRKAGEESLPKYSKKLKLKVELDNSAEEQQSILKTILGGEGNNSEANIAFWDKEVKDLEIYKDKAQGTEHKEKDVLQLKEEERRLKEDLQRIRDAMNRFQKQLAEIERKANEILVYELAEDYLYCKTSVDLEGIRSRLKEFIDKNETNKDNVLKVMKIFEEIESEEKEKVSELFGEESSVAHYFNEITDGLYREVVFNREKGNIEVRHKDGLALEAEKLSGGAYDQLYFSIRLALGEKILKGKKGFFIMDDPFIKASPDRLQRQISMLRKISQSGWQIIYFTAKGEVKEALKEEIDSRKISYFEIEGLL